MEYIPDAIIPSVAAHPKNVIFLTADAFGVLPPVSRLTRDQAMYYFINGYTSKLAGTEAGVTEPQPFFSPCFGGLGCTLRAALDVLPDAAQIQVSELNPLIQEWCAGPLAGVNGEALASSVNWGRAEWPRSMWPET